MLMLALDPAATNTIVSILIWFVIFPAFGHQYWYGMVATKHVMAMSRAKQRLLKLSVT